MHQRHRGGGNQRVQCSLEHAQTQHQRQLVLDRVLGIRTMAHVQRDITGVSRKQAIVIGDARLGERAGQRSGNDLTRHLAPMRRDLQMHARMAEQSLTVRQV